MKNILIKSLIAASCLLGAVSCDDFLEQEVPGKFPIEDYYKTDGDAQQAIIAVYDILSAHYNANWASMYMVKTLLSDESNAGGSNDGDQVGYQNLDDFTTDSQNDKVRDVWAQCYIAIFRANKAINNLPGSNDLQQRLIAEAKTLRAFAYFDLVMLWGDVPLVLEDVPPGSYGTTERTPKAQVYDQIEKDLTEAIDVLPLKSEYGAAEKFRVSRGTAQALLGKVHLFQEEWDEALVQFEAVIASNEYELENSVQAVFARQGEFGKESVFELSFISTEGYDWNNFPWGGKPESNIHVQLMGPRSDYYTKAPADSLIGGWGFNVPKQKLYDAFINTGDVNRRRVTVMSEAELEAAGGNWSVTNAWDHEGYFQRKYGTFAGNTGGPINELNYGTNFRIIRYADVLLMAAEAAYRDGDEDQARDYVNDVRTRPGTNLSEISATGAALFDAIVLERQLELAFEGHRFVDLVRWGRASTELVTLGFSAGKHEVLPIPINEINTSGLDQNQNY